MINEIFISDLSNNLLVGNSHTFPFNNTQITYPITFYKNQKYSHLKVNDVILSISFIDLDNFIATKFLLDLKYFLEQRLIEITTEAIKESYFMLLDLLKTPELIINHKNTLFKTTALFPGNIINLVQKISFIEDINGNIISNKTYGEIFLNQIGQSELKLEFLVPENVNFKTPYPFNFEAKILTIFCKNLENKSLVSFNIKKNALVYFKLTKEGNGYTFNSEYKKMYKNIEFIIPVGNKVYRCDIKSSSGTYKFDLKTGSVHWRFNDYIFDKESIIITTFSIEDDILKEEIKEPILVNFELNETEKLPIELKSCTNLDERTESFWMKCITKGEDYRFYHK